MAEQYCDIADQKRSRRPTEKGLVFSLDTKYKQLGEVFRQLCGQCEHINMQMNSNVNSELMRKEYTKWMTLYEQYLNVHDEYCNMLTPDIRDKYLNDEFVKKDSKLSGFKTSVENWFSNYVTGKAGDDIGVRDSVSQISRKSRRTVASSRVSSSVLSAKLREEQKSIELAARAAALKCKQELQLEKMKISMREEELEIDTQLAISEAKKKVIDNLVIATEETEIIKSNMPISPVINYTKSLINSCVSSVTPDYITVDVLNENVKSSSHVVNNGLTPNRVNTDTNVHNVSFGVAVNDNNVSVYDKDTVNVDVSTFGVNRSSMNVNANSFVPGNAVNVSDNVVENIYDANVKNVNRMYTDMHIPPHYAMFSGQRAPHSQSSDNALLSVVRHLKKPSVELMKFNGDPMEYWKFIRQFNTRVVANCDDVNEKMAYLEQFTIGEANRIVSGFSFLPAAKGYKAALEELECRYGSADTIANAFVQKALNWGPIKADNPKGLDNFAIFLVECENAVKGIDAIRVLEFSENMKRLISKLPFHCHEKWRGNEQSTKNKGKSVTFHNLVEFVKMESSKANDPTYGRNALAVDSQKLGFQKRRQKGSFATTEAKFVGNKPAQTTSRELHIDSASTQCRSEAMIGNTPAKNIKMHAFSKPCIHCKDPSHALEVCKVLASLPYDKKLSELKLKGLCYGCLRRGHMKRDCRSRVTCGKCKSNHPTLLHSEERPVYTGSSNSNGNSASSDVRACAPESVCSYAGLGVVDSALAIIPVSVKRRNGLKSLQVYAFLDPGSSVTFCTESLMYQLGLNGRKLSVHLDTIGSPYSMKTYGVEDLQIGDVNMKNIIDLPCVYTKCELPVSKMHIPTREELDRWDHLRDIHFPQVNGDICLLIGNNVPDAYSPTEFRSGPQGTPHATKTRLGWIPWNIIRTDNRTTNKYPVNRIGLNAVEHCCNNTRLEQLVRNTINLDFPERISDDDKSPSQDDKLFIKKVEDSIQLNGQHYYVCLPFKHEEVKFPNNSEQALQRLRSLERKMRRLPQFHKDYMDFMKSILEKGYAEMVPEEELSTNDGRVWYIPHHGVYHPHKPGKIRVVFDCSATFSGVSLNNQLLSGPDLTNTLLGVLLRFRKESVAIQGDIESMFYQVRVPKHDCDCLRFYWWPNVNLQMKPAVFRMCVHIFGAVSSPSCSNVALRQTAKDNNNLYDSVTTETVLKDFYVDDCLHSTGTEEDAIQLVKSVTSLLSRGGFHLTKWVSSSTSVVESIPRHERSKDLVDLDLAKEVMPSQRALGVYWSVKDDMLGFRISVKDDSFTRRSILSTVSSVFHPLGFVTPFILTAKQLLQDLCRRKVDWDDKVTGSDLVKWKRWLDDLPLLENFTISRCYKPEVFGEVVSYQIHTFSDASDVGYGTVSYLRITNSTGDVQTAIILGKSRVAPLKKVSTPRMELTAAVMAVRLTNKIVKELGYPIDKSKDVFLWTDSMAVLRYIANESTRFQTFVANRITVIRENSEVHQWRYVKTDVNPADTASRGQSMQKLFQNQLWKYGPSFLLEPENDWPSCDEISSKLIENDPEVKKACSQYSIPERELLKYLGLKIQQLDKV